MASLDDGYNSISAEDALTVGKNDKLFLIRLPHNFDSKALNGVKLDFHKAGKAGSNVIGSIQTKEAVERDSSGKKRKSTSAAASADYKVVLDRSTTSSSQFRTTVQNKVGNPDNSIIGPSFDAVISVSKDMSSSTSNESLVKMAGKQFFRNVSESYEKRRQEDHLKGIFIPTGTSVNSSTSHRKKKDDSEPTPKKAKKEKKSKR